MAQVDTLDGRLSISETIDGSNDGRPVTNLAHVVPCSNAQGLLALLAEHATSADDINTILDRIYKNHR